MWDFPSKNLDPLIIVTQLFWPDKADGMNQVRKESWVCGCGCAGKRPAPLEAAVCTHRQLWAQWTTEKILQTREFYIAPTTLSAHSVYLHDIPLTTAPLSCITILCLCLFRRQTISRKRTQKIPHLWMVHTTALETAWQHSSSTRSDLSGFFKPMSFRNRSEYTTASQSWIHWVWPLESPEL